MANCKKTFNLEDPRDIEDIHNMLFGEGSDNAEIAEDFGDESDTDEEDMIETRLEDSETEQSDISDEEDLEVSDGYFIGKNKETKWSKNVPSTRVRAKPHNILKKLPGVIGEARNARTPLACWSNLMTDDILELILHYTNTYIGTVKPSYARERDARLVDLIELKAYLGLLYLAGVWRSNRQSLEDLWGTDDDGVEKFRMVMSIKRFKFITRCLRFDDKITREERKKTDRLAAIREVFTIFVANSQKCYTLSENVTIDEKLEGFRGRCIFKQYIPNKPNKYGIKIYALVDAQVFYLYNLEIYAGLQPDGIYRMSNKPEDVVMRLVEPIINTGRNVTADNWFSSIPLIEKLREKKLSYVGTLKKNKREIPHEFLTTKEREVNSSMFGFRKEYTLVSYVPKKGKCVIVVSSLHNDNAIDPETAEKKKPEIITFYNKTKGGVDTTDKLCASYNVARNVRRWPMVVFFAILNMCGINSQVIYFGNDQKVIRRKLFLKQLSHELVLPQLKRRSQLTIGMPLDLQHKLHRYRVHEEAESNTENQVATQGIKRKRCEDCTGPINKRKLTKYLCYSCKKVICLSHINSYCSECSNKLSRSLSN